MLANKLYSSVITLSLTAAITCSIVFLSFLISETSTDSFHPNAARMVQMTSEDPFGTASSIPYVTGAMKDFVKQYPEVESVCQVDELRGTTVKVNDDSYRVPVVIAADDLFFDMFNFSIQGNRDGALARNKLVLTAERAKALFGTTDVIGKILALSTSDTTMLMEVSAIVLPSVHNSHLKFDAVIPRENVKRFFGGATYLQLTQPGMAAALASKINADKERPGLAGPGTVNYFVNPLSESYFNTDNKFPFAKTRSRAFLTTGYVACGLVLFIAGFNFINLFMLFWQKRQKSVGVRKTLGVSKWSLFRFSLTETAGYVVIAFVLSLAATWLLLPLFNEMFDGSVSTGYLLDSTVVVAVGAVLLFITIVMSLLSVWKQLAVKPVTQLTGKTPGMKSGTSMLFVIQFFVSITLVIGAVTVTRQIDHLSNAPLGFNRHIIQINSPGRDAAKLMPALKQEVLKIADVKSAMVGSGNPVSGNVIARYEITTDSIYAPYLFMGDEDLFRTFDLKLVEGEMPSGLQSGKAVNEALVRKFGLKDPIGRKIPGSEDIIIGVVKDFTCGSFKVEIPPVIISYDAEGTALLVDYGGEDLALVLPALQQAWKSVFPDQLFGYKVLQEDLMKKYKDDTFLFRVVMAMATVTMALSCFGLFALSWAVTQSRAKEMSIRKVFGATVGDVLSLLTASFSRRILMAFVLAVPVSYYFINGWLSTFANRIEIDLWIFVMAFGVVALIAVFTLSVQTVKAAVKNPVDEMKQL